MAKIMDPILPIQSTLGYWAMILGSFGGPGIPSMLIYYVPGQQPIGSNAMKLSGYAIHPYLLF